MFAVCLEVKTEVKKRLRQNVFGTEDERDEQPAESPVAVEERVDRLELNVRKRGLYERGRIHRPVVKEFFEVPMHAITLSAGGGTKAAFPGRVPPIQF